MFSQFNPMQFSNFPGFDSNMSNQGAPWMMFSGIPSMMQMQNAFMVMSLRSQIDMLRFWDGLLAGVDAGQQNMNPIMMPMVQAWQASLLQHKEQVSSQRKFIASSIDTLEQLLNSWQQNWTPTEAAPTSTPDEGQGQK